jgi:hypothetical protein
MSSSELLINAVFTHTNCIKMKNIHKFGCVLALILGLCACDKGFDELNTSPIALGSVNPDYQLNQAIINASPGLSQIQGGTSIVKQQARVFTGVGALGNFNTDGRETSSSNWNSGYQNIRNLVDILDKTQEDATKANLYNMTRIWKAFAFMIITDSYGDIPYSQAGLGYSEGVVKPAYDPQESIYKDILNELDNAASSLDNTKPIVNTDILYKGDITKWKRFGYSLMLRAAMRLSKVDQETAKKYVTIAVSGGVMESNDDNAMLIHTSDFPNAVGSSLNGGQSYYQYLVEDFVNFLKDNNDPRLASIAVRYVGAKGIADQDEAHADRSPTAQIGMPMGYDNTTIGPIAEAAGLASFYAYSQLDRTRMGSPTAPVFFVTYGQTQLLMAEAASRGWTSGSPATYFSNGIKGDMERYAEYGSNTSISEQDINNYISAHPLQSGHELEQINTQYWVAAYLNGPEAWANFRRSGYPNLPPNPLKGDLGPDEDFMRRFGYPESESVVNKDNYQQAVSQQGPDRIDTRIWWDKK